MPVYDYKCNACNKPFTKLVIKKDTLIECPYCKNTDVTKLMSAFKTSNSGNRAQSSCSTNSFT
jgi:putative FmdB family regulatory protein